MKNNIRLYLTALSQIWFPDLCLLCRQHLRSSESEICFSCVETFPITNYHKEAENPLVKRLLGRIEINHASAFLHFHKAGIVQNAIHQLKYKEKNKLGEKLGRLLAYQLKDDDSLIKNVDLIVPVPLHWKREKERGYNQCDAIAQGISDILQVPYSTQILQRLVENISQTKRSRYDRWENVEGIFRVADTVSIKGKHILLVDDVITTGSTIEACVIGLQKVEDVRLSVVSLAVAGAT